VVSPNDTKKDQELGVFIISAKKLGKFKMVIKVQPPNYLDFLPENIIGITIILLNFRYKNIEFIRIGYYVNNELNSDEKFLLDHSIKLNLKLIIRKILINQPRITHYPCLFDKF
jgi:histone chaperone ASF1